MATPIGMPLQWELTVAVDSLPLRLADDDEIHYLACYYEPVGRDHGDSVRILHGVGITPNGRIGLYAHLLAADVGDGVRYMAPALTPINTVHPDGMFHVISTYYADDAGGGGNLYQRSIAYDGVTLVTRTETDAVDDDLVTGWVAGGADHPGPDAPRLYVLNSPSGATRMGVRMSKLVIAKDILEYVIPFPLPAILIPTINTVGFNMNLGLQYVSPLPATPYGPIPNADPNTQIVGWHKTPFVPRSPANPTYAPVPR